MLIPLSVAIHNSPLLCSQNAFTLSSAKDGSSPLRCLSKVVLVSSGIMRNAPPV